MKQLMRQVSERLVGAVLPSVEAGACVPEHGQCCRRGYAFSCNGICSVRRSGC
ncbi:hypothetical protein [Nonomuraea candida]|uniref:hypothetical protein n=1 Tax=Nonomuraea candida TaxID=359159 RepID=UPI0012FCCEE7|nr:hypothetical protein [Nonomuraea candida]